MVMSEGMNATDVQAGWLRLAQEVRTAVLLTMRNGRPFGSLVPYLFGTDWTHAYIHVSGLALHTQQLRDDHRVGLFIAEPDGPGRNPSSLRRMNLQGTAAVVLKTRPDYALLRDRYLERFPQSAMLFGFGDFSLWELSMTDAHLVLGFGHAYQAQSSTPLQWAHQRPEGK